MFIIVMASFFPFFFPYFYLPPSVPDTERPDPFFSLFIRDALYVISPTCYEEEESRACFGETNNPVGHQAALLLFLIVHPYTTLPPV